MREKEENEQKERNVAKIFNLSDINETTFSGRLFWKRHHHVVLKNLSSLLSRWLSSRSE
jgi:hypothetical protein